MNIFYYYIQSIPESMGLIALSLALAKVGLRWGRIFIGGVFLSILVYYIRSFHIGFGLHLPATIFVIFLAITRMTIVRPSRAIISVFSSLFILALLEYLINIAFLAYTHMEFKQALADKRLWALVGIVQDGMLFSIALIVSHFLKPIEGSWKMERYQKRL